MFTEDLSVYFDILASPATLNSVGVQGYFDNAYALGDVGMYGVASTQPTLTLPTANVPTQPVGMLVEVAGQRFTVAVHQPNGKGISLLVLETAL